MSEFEFARTITELFLVRRVCDRDCRALFGVTVRLCSRIWHLLADYHISSSKPLHLLICLHFLKCYDSEIDNALLFHCDEKTLRKWQWFYTFGLAQLNIVSIVVACSFVIVHIVVSFIRLILMQDFLGLRMAPKCSLRWMESIAQFWSLTHFQEAIFLTNWMVLDCAMKLDLIYVLAILFGCTAVFHAVIFLILLWPEVTIFIASMMTKELLQTKDTETPIISCIRAPFLYVHGVCTK